MNAPPKTSGLFQSLLGGAFDDLPPEIRKVHGGPGQWRGTATVRRPASGPGKWMGSVAGFPDAVMDAPCAVSIAATSTHERWTRAFGSSRPLRSTLHASRGCLAERMGLATLSFRLVAENHGVSWQLQRVAMLGVPLPRGLFTARAGCGSSAGRYHFTVQVSAWGMGELIAYDGVLHVPRT